MAEIDLDPNDGLTDKRQGLGSGASNLGTAANYQSVTALRTRLGVINGTYYTSDRLNQMTKNDMVYAVRLNDDAAGI